MNNKYDFKNLTPFKWCVIQNFPFIEEDFDAITNYQLLCKIVEYLNNTIASTNELGEEVETISANFIDLKNYVDNYFDSQDWQQLVNNKLDVMATDGTLNRIINQEIFGEINENLDNLNNPFNNTLFVGDSYILGRFNDGTTDAEQLTGWANLIITLHNLQNCYVMGQSGGGIAHTPPGGYNFKDYIQNHLSEITDTTTIKNVVVCAGYNDYRYDSTTISTAVTELYNYLKQTFTNLKNVYVGMIGNHSGNYTEGFKIRNALYNNTLVGYKNIVRDGGIYLNGVETLLKNYNFYANTDAVHPTQTGQYQLAYYIWQAMVTGKATPIQPNATGRITHKNINTENTSFSFNMTSYGEIMKMYFNSGRIYYNTDVNITNNRMYLGVLDLPLYRSTLGRVVVPAIFAIYPNNTEYIPGFLLLESDGTVQALFNPSSDITLPSTTNMINIVGASFDIPVIQC